MTDGTSIWVVNDGSTDKVFKYTLVGSLLGSWTMSSGGGSPTGITLDQTGASRDLWVVDNATDTVYRYTAARSLTSGSAAAASAFALNPFDTNPQGIADPPPAGGPADDPAPMLSVALPGNLMDGAWGWSSNRGGPSDPDVARQAPAPAAGVVPPTRATSSRGRLRRSRQTRLRKRPRCRVGVGTRSSARRSKDSCCQFWTRLPPVSRDSERATVT